MVYRSSKILFDIRAWRSKYTASWYVVHGMAGTNNNFSQKPSLRARNSYKLHMVIWGKDIFAPRVSKDFMPYVTSSCYTMWILQNIRNSSLCTDRQEIPSSIPLFKSIVLQS